MARSDLILSLARGATRGDELLARRAIEALVAEERSKQHHVFADRLEAQLRSKPARDPQAERGFADSAESLIHQINEDVLLSDLVLPDAVRVPCEELIEEHMRADLLRSYGLEPRHRLLLQGPPGNGKTTLAAAIASSLMYPLLVVRYEGIVGSYLGETAGRLAKLFDYVRTRRCVLFFDEFDTLGKERGDTHESGEIKRVVSSLLLQIDALPATVVVVTATNHPELLDRAVWRRFQLRLRLPAPGPAQIHEWLARFEVRFDQSLGVPLDKLSMRLHGLSFSEIESFALDVQRRWVLAQPGADVRSIVAGRLKQLKAQGRLRARNPSQNDAG